MTSSHKLFVVSVLFLLVSISLYSIDPQRYLYVYVWNKTDQNVFIYTDEELVFALKPNEKKTKYLVDKQKVKKISAQTYNGSYKWKAIALAEYFETFSWKLTLQQN